MKRVVRVPVSPRMQRESISKGNGLIKATKTTAARKSRKSQRLKNSWRCQVKSDEMGNGRGRAKTEELDGAGGECARGPVATVNARRAGRLLETFA
eukprot:4380768-Pleurochrysis_carterae.AAC.1